MKNIKNHLMASLFFVALVLPQNSSAYETIKQTATLLNDHTILYTITYRFGFLNRQTYLPIGAVRGLENGSIMPYVGYDILTDGQVTASGKVGALVLSKAEIKNNQYFLPEGKAADLTLVAILELPKDGSLDPKNTVLKMNHLPFVMVKDKEAGRTFLNEREMKPYITPVVR
ncbi:MAG: hypothetical protein ABL927_07950 [Bdellovibrionales bacterium]|nr:hypothetical protein [Candidatus Paceibacterota bacterium]